MYFPLLNFIPRYGSDLDDMREFESMPQPSNQAKHQLYCDLTWLTGRQHVASSFFAPFCPILPNSPNLPFLPRLNMSVGHQVRHISENYRIFPDLSTVNNFAGKILVWSARRSKNLPVMACAAVVKLTSQRVSRQSWELFCLPLPRAASRDVMD